MNTASPTTLSIDENYRLVEAAIVYFQEHQHDQPRMSQVAKELDISEGHLHRLFREWTGLTPKQFLQSITVDKAKQLLEESSSVFDTALDVGLSGSSRLHDHFVTLEAMTPAEYRDGGADLTIQYGTVSTPFGLGFIAFTERGVCQFTFTDGESGEDGIERLKKTFPNAHIQYDQSAAESLVSHYWSSHSGNLSDVPSLKLLVKGTNFQVQVWRALLQIGAGFLADYSAIATTIGKPDATRAVASAIGANPVAWFIPCHRVIRRDGSLGGYRWGMARKKMLLVKEQRAD